MGVIVNAVENAQNMATHMLHNSRCQDGVMRTFDILNEIEVINKFAHSSPFDLAFCQECPVIMDYRHNV